MDEIPQTMLARTLMHFGHAVRETVYETLWPTRCAICDAPGLLLCDQCRLSLPFIDYWRACTRCGAPYGNVLCTECCTTMLTRWNRSKLPFADLRSVITHDPPASRLVTVLKDQGEQRLAGILAHMMARAVPPTWLTENLGTHRATVITFIPSTVTALRKRGFDHAELIARHLSDTLGLPLQTFFARPQSKDQRNLGRAARVRNMDKRFMVLKNSPHTPSVILVDDVCTTGATLFAAADALTSHGVTTIHCLTFARVW